jgi:Arc/MetJ-type ribon-helix-helix transcriptional regulator
MEGLVGNEGLYPSRSELIRIAVRDFLKKELEIAKNFPNFAEPSNYIIPEPIEKDDTIVRVPWEVTEGHETRREYKTFKIVAKVR